MSNYETPSWYGEDIIGEPVNISNISNANSIEPIDWDEIFAPHTHATPFMEQFGLEWDYGHFTMSPDPSQIDSSMRAASCCVEYSTPSFSSHSISCEGREQQYYPASAQQVLSQDVDPSVNPQITNSLGVTREVNGNDHSRLGRTRAAGKLPIPPVQQRARGPQRTAKAAPPCDVGDCCETFACAWDRKRHMDDVHAQGKYIYKCQERSCGYLRPRKDKVHNHCMKRKHAGFVRIAVDNGQNAGELEAMLEQRRKKGRKKEGRLAVCEECGKKRRQSR